MFEVAAFEAAPAVGAAGSLTTCTQPVAQSLLVIATVPWFLMQKPTFHVPACIGADADTDHDDRVGVTCPIE